MNIRDMDIFDIIAILALYVQVDDHTCNNSRPTTATLNTSIDLILNKIDSEFKKLNERIDNIVNERKL